MPAVPQSVLEFGEFRIDPRRRTLTNRAGDLIALTPKHFDTLLYLVENAGEVLEKDQLLSAIWPGMIVEENNLSQAISQLRRILADDGAEHRYILTVPRRGYRFVADVRPVTEAAAGAAVPGPTQPAADVAPQVAIPEPARAATPPGAASLPPGAPAIPAPSSPPPKRIAAVAAAVVVLLAAAASIYAWRSATPASGAANEKSIAVLPFVNFSGAREDEFFSEGINEDLVTQLAQISGLKVISRTSMQEYKDSKKPLREIARELGVAHILQGSVRRGDNRFRITAQLVDPAREGYLWAKSYDREIKDVLAVQSDVTAEIAAALKTRLLEPEKEHLDKWARGNPEAYVLYRKGTHLISFHPERTQEDRQQAREYFERVIAMDPASPLGYAGLATYYFRSALWREAARPDAYARAEALAKQALAADADSVEAHLILASIYSQVHWNWSQAEKFAKRAVELNPGNALVWDVYRSSVLEPTGRLDEALVAQRRAVALDPLNVAVAFRLAALLNYLRRCDEAARQVRLNFELDPKFILGYVVVARCHEINGNFTEAIAAWRKVKRPWAPDKVLDELQAVVDSPAGKADPKAYWRARLAWGKRYGENVTDQHYHTAAFAAQAGEHDEAFRYLDRAIERHERELLTLKVDPQFDPIRKDPRFTAVLKRLNLS